MSTSIKISEEDKETLERLQAFVTLRAGRKMTQQEILSTLVRDAYAKSDEFLDKIISTGKPMSDQEYEKILLLIEDWGVETSWIGLDQLLYGTAKQKKK